MLGEFPAWSFVAQANDERNSSEEDDDDDDDDDGDDGDVIDCHVNGDA